MNSNYMTLDDLMHLFYNNAGKQNTESVETKDSKPTMNIFNEDALKQALRENENETIELQQALEMKQKEKDLLYKRLENMKSQTTLVRKGSDVAITMSRGKLMNLRNELTNILKTSDAERLTFNISNVN